MRYVPGERGARLHRSTHEYATLHTVLLYPIKGNMFLFSPVNRNVSRSALFFHTLLGQRAQPKKWLPLVCYTFEEGSSTTKLSSKRRSLEANVSHGRQACDGMLFQANFDIGVFKLSCGRHFCGISCPHRDATTAVLEVVTAAA